MLISSGMSREFTSAASWGGMSENCFIALCKQSFAWTRYIT
jgi:hypothetical protein